MKPTRPLATVDGDLSDSVRGFKSPPGGGGGGGGGPELPKPSTCGGGSGGGGGPGILLFLEGVNPIIPLRIVKIYIRRMSFP